MEKNSLSLFERYLSLWVALCMGLGILIGYLFPGVPAFLSWLEIAHVSVPIAILIWLMIYPMMLKVDFSSIGSRVRKPKGMIITLTVNWLIKPFTMYLIAALFFKHLLTPFIPIEKGQEYLAGAVLLGAAPCTAMVFVWSHLTKGDPTFTVIQVAVNDLVIILAFTPIVAFLLGLGDVTIPFDTLLLSVILFVVIPLAAGAMTRSSLIRRRGLDYVLDSFIPRFKHTTIAGLLLTLVIIFTFQAQTIISAPLDIALIALPLVIQTFLIFLVAYLWAYWWGLPHTIAAPASMIGASNFFELAVAVAISLFGLSSGATLVTVVGVLVEVPVMLSLVSVANRTRKLFDVRSKGFTANL